MQEPTPSHLSSIGVPARGRARLHAGRALDGDELRVDLAEEGGEARAERHERRREQKLTWMRTMLQERLLAHFDADPMFAAARADAEAAVSDGSLPPSVAVDQLLERLGS